jgi:hypothetical protein
VLFAQHVEDDILAVCAFYVYCVGGQIESVHKKYRRFILFSAEFAVSLPLIGSQS